MKILLKICFIDIILYCSVTLTFGQGNIERMPNNQQNTRARNELNSSRADSATGNYLSALKHYQLYKELTDTIRGKSLERKIAELQARFDSDKKNHETTFRVQQQQIKMNKIRSEAAIRYIVIGSIVVLIVFAGMMYNRYRIKKISELSLATKQNEINDKTDLLEILLKEKDWLLKEVHHRVKNNLQIVISLLNTQSSYLKNEDAIAAIRNSQQRMYAISLIHQKLYQSENMATIDMPNYIRNLVEYLEEAFKNEKRVEFITELAPLTLGLIQAVPLGLILNEAITNAVKYAFSGMDDGGRVLVKLSNYGNSNYELCVIDNGQGLPKGFDPDEANSLGMSLMRGLSQQLNGELVFSSISGLSVCLTFKVPA